MLASSLHGGAAQRGNSVDFLGGRIFRL